MSRVLFHLDMDAFYASIEQRDYKELQGKPVVVGGNPTGRGVVCAASYEARAFGIRSAMPASTARRLCPHATFLPPRFETYRQNSSHLHTMLQATGARVEPVSIDEAYLEFPPPPQSTKADAALIAYLPLARQLKQRILHELKLTCSIGIASNKLLCKIGSDFDKPNGLTLIPESQKKAFLRHLPVSAVHGVGRVTTQKLQQIGITTLAHLQDYQGDLRSLIGNWATQLQAYALGEDPRPLDLSQEVKSISSEETFEHNTQDRPFLRHILRTQAQEISEKLHREQLAAFTIQIKVRYPDFSTLTRQLSLQEPLHTAQDLYRLGCYLLARDQLVSRPLRLLGLGAAQLTSPSRQLLLPMKVCLSPSHPVN